MSETFGFLFPGQGAQFVGMGADLYEAFPAAREVYDRAEDILELPIRRISFEGPAETLRETRYTQPAVLVHSLAVLALLREVRPVLVAGHSLGEYTALYAAAVFDFATVLRLIKRRAELMFASGEKRPGMMAAVIGIDASTVEAVCREAGGVVVGANYNEPRQTVISGEPEAVQRAMELAKSKGAYKVLPLPVSGAFHSPLLEDAAREFADYLDRFSINPPHCPVVMNVTGRPTTDVREIRQNLHKQLVSPVRWVEVMESARELGCRRFFEVGPGQILAGLAKRIDRDLVVTPLGKAPEIEGFLKGV